MGNWFFWLVIFVVGGLIVSFLVVPDSFNTFKENAKNILNPIFLNVSFNDEDVVKLSSYQFCLDNEFNSIICKGTCGSNGLNYKTFRCINGEAICYCKKS